MWLANKTIMRRRECGGDVKECCAQQIKVTKALFGSNPYRFRIFMYDRYESNSQINKAIN